jgi:hypothetical protein
VFPPRFSKNFYSLAGIGVDDMFLLMSSWSEILPENEAEKTVEYVPILVGQTLAKAGLGITITSITDFLAFLIGSFSKFRSVTSFSLYAGPLQTRNIIVQYSLSTTKLFTND